MSKENWYVFFTVTGKEGSAAEEIKKFYAGNIIKPLNCSVEILFKKQGQVKREIRPSFPGYLFATSSMSNDEFILNTREFVSKSRNIIRLLRYGDSGIAAIEREEKIFLERLLQGEEYIKASSGYIQDEKIVVTDGPFIGQESAIKSINRHKMQATIEIKILGEMRKVTVGLEILAKI